MKLQKSLTDLILANSGPLVLCLLPHFSTRGLTVDKRLKEKLWGLIVDDPYAGEHWPLTLEMAHLEMSDPGWASVKAPEVLRILHEERRTIVRWEAPPKVFEDESDEETPEPEYALDSFGDDYNSYDEDEPSPQITSPSDVLF